MLQEVYYNFIQKYSRHHLLPIAYQGLGRCHEALGKKEEALKIYQELAALYSNTAWKDMAEARMKLLGSRVR